jgi:hypothetical protein
MQMKASLHTKIPKNPPPIKILEQADSLTSQEISQTKPSSLHFTLR